MTATAEQFADDEPPLPLSARCETETWARRSRSIFAFGGGRISWSLGRLRTRCIHTPTNSHFGYFTPSLTRNCSRTLSVDSQRELGELANGAPLPKAICLKDITIALIGLHHLHRLTIAIFLHSSVAQWRI